MKIRVSTRDLKKFKKFLRKKEDLIEFTVIENIIIKKRTKYLKYINYISSEFQKERR